MCVQSNSQFSRSLPIGIVILESVVGISNNKMLFEAMSDLNISKIIKNNKCNPFKYDSYYSSITGGIFECCNIFNITNFINIVTFFTNNYTYFNCKMFLKLFVVA